ncbi:4-oxalomesaconate tautomerase [Jannaschia sp. S6380]|uniref:PrpF domain-containing protein n=1 Tax=Jannaschia sp. S6380 TaxID=2926408 RepID=UPI001FF30E7B|nr:PrpF domain-containing protein [Jannaschia sp. S6380]MCK0167223.1 4-oxalomesaconate tautomerase [Jannaschia sp. S6380]
MPGLRGGPPGTTGIPFLLMRGGTSRGPCLRRADLPADRDALTALLLDIVGAGHPLNIDGVGGGASVTTKVVMLSRADRDGADIDYFFAQVGVEDRIVDYAPTCGNMLAAVGPAAIEFGLVEATGPETSVVIHAVNTGALVDARIRTPDGMSDYAGDCAIDGVPGRAAPVLLNFRNTVGALTGKLLPSGQATDRIEGVDVSCVDLAMPVVFARAADLGLSGAETPAELDAMPALLDRIEGIRRTAAARMGMPDPAASVVPKFALLSPPRHGGTATVRYFTPWRCHPTVAVTGAQCTAACIALPDTVADGLAAPRAGVTCAIEHASGRILVEVNRFDPDPAGAGVDMAVVRTARKIAEGRVFPRPPA